MVAYIARMIGKTANPRTAFQLLERLAREAQDPRAVKSFATNYRKH